MPKGHPISVPCTWPGHRDWEPPEPVLEVRTVPSIVMTEYLRRRDARARGEDPDAPEPDLIPLYSNCPVPGGSCLLCDDDHCREL